MVALEEEAANHPKVRRSRAGVLSVAGKGAPVSASGVAQEGERNRTTVTCRNPLDDIETGVVLARDEPGGCLLIAQVVSGIEVARAWFRLLYGTWEPVVSGAIRQWSV